jgi:plasmid stability protein
MIRDEWTDKAKKMSLKELRRTLCDNLKAHGYSADDELREILTYCRVYYERYNSNLDRVLSSASAGGVTCTELEEAFAGNTPKEKEESVNV